MKNADTATYVKQLGNMSSEKDRLIDFELQYSTVLLLCNMHFWSVNDMRH